MPRSNPVEVTLDIDTDSEDERLLNSCNKSNYRKPALPSNSGLNLNPTRSSSPELTSLPPSPKRPRTQSTGAGARRPRIAASAKKVAQALAREQKKTLAQAKRQEKERARREKEAARQAKIAEKIRQTFSDAEIRGTFRRNEVDVVVSTQLYDDTSRNDVLSHVRAIFQGQVISSDMNIHNLVTWRRRNKLIPTLSSEKNKNLEAGISLIIFSGANYWDMMLSNEKGRSLFERAEDILSKRKGEEIFYVIYGIECERRKRTKTAVQPGAKERIISMQAIQDSYTVLYMKYGIRAHAFNKVTDAAKYIVELTDAVCDKPYYQQDDFLDATLRYRDSRKKISNRSTVISMRDISGSQEIANAYDKDDEDTEGMEYGDNSNEEDGPVLIPFMRSEGREDLGYMYMSFLAQIPRMSYETAKAIRETYPTLYHLFRAYGGCPSLDEKHSFLADIRCEPNNRRIGPALSKSIATVLTSWDPSTAFRM